MKTVFLGLGSNLGDREENIRKAIRRLGENGVQVDRVSPFYETEPEGIVDQPWFLNAAAAVRTDLEPLDLLRCVKQIETAMKRRTTVKNGPRLIDIDILLYETLVIQTPALEIPHPRFRGRRFVLAPLADLAADLRDPLTGRTMVELRDASPPSRIRFFG